MSAYRWALEWSNPFTAPPDGQPRVLREELGARNVPPPGLVARRVLGSGYAITWRGATVEKPPRQLSDAAKHSIRRKALGRRLTAKAPLFAAEWAAETIAAQPDYFGE